MKIFLLKAALLLFLNTNLVAVDLTFGSSVRVKHVLTGRYLHSNERSFQQGKFDKAREFDRRYKDIGLSADSNFFCNWVVKGQHSEDLRWNASLGAVIKSGVKVRLENLANHSNLTIIRESKDVLTVKRIGLPMGTGSANDDLVIQYTGSDGKPNRAGNIIEMGETFRIIFKSLQGQDHLVFVGKDQEVKAVKLDKASNEQLKSATWVFEIVDKDYAAKDMKRLEGLESRLDERSDLTKLDGMTVSTVNVWQADEQTDVFLAASDNDDFYAYFLNNLKIQRFEKLANRFAQIEIDKGKKIWGVDRYKDVRSGDINGELIENWVKYDKKAEYVFAGGGDLYLLNSVGWDLYRIVSYDEKKLKLEEKPFEKGVVNASVCDDGTVCWIDIEGNVFKTNKNRNKDLFKNNVKEKPPFSKISTAGSFDKMYVALLRADSRMFLSKDGKAFFDSGIDEVLDVSVTQNGFIAFVMRRHNWVNGRIYTTTFEKLEKWFSENNEKIDKDLEFENTEDFLNHYSYVFELGWWDDLAMSRLVLNMDVDSNPIFSALKKYEPMKDFFNYKLEPAVEKVNLSRTAKLAFERLKQGFSDQKEIVENKLPEVKNEDSSVVEEKLKNLEEKVVEQTQRIDELEKEKSIMEEKIESIEDGQDIEP